MFRFRAGLIALCTAALLLAAGSPASAAAGDRAPAERGPASNAVRTALAAGPYHIQFYHSLRCVDNPGPSTGNVWLDQYTCVAQSNELWYFDFVAFDGEDYWYEVRNAYSGKCMNVEQASQANGAHVIQYSCAGSYWNNQWAIAPVGSGWYWMYPRHSTGCLNVAGGSLNNNAKLIQYTCGYYTNEYVTLY